MAVLKYVKKNSQDDISFASSGSELNADEDNAVKRQLFRDNSEPKKKRVIYGTYDALQQAGIAN